MKEVILIGTSHIARHSVSAVRKIIDKENPEMVAVELDIMRFQALLQKKRKQKFSFYNIRAVGFKGFIFAIIGSYLSKKLGRMVGVQPGADMMAAINEAKGHNLKIALIDRNINITLARFSKFFSWREKWNMIVDVFRGMTSAEKELERLGISKLDLSKVPPEELIDTLLERTKERYPNLYKVLVSERNVFMTKRIIKLMEQDDIKKLVVVVGAGHKRGMMMLLEDNAKFKVRSG
jgi:pheromone shutdown-related protein TraB